VGLRTVVALLFAAASATLTNLAYLREHDAVSALPALTLSRPLQSLRLLLSDRGWLAGFALESAGFALYAAALALGSLALVQSIAAGGIGVLAVVSARMTRRRLDRQQRVGVVLSVIGLLALGASLAGGSGAGGKGTTGSIVLWLGGTAAAGLLVLALRDRVIPQAAADGIAGGLFFSIGDISTKVATEGGGRVIFALTLIAGYTLGTSLLQIGYQRGGALTVAGLATLLTNALPIAAGTVIFDEPVPGGALGGARILAFVAVIAGAIALARPDARQAAAAPG